MAKNIQSSSGLAEDLIRAFVQMGCAEMHLKTLYEKTVAELENGMVDLADADAREAHIAKANDYIEDLKQTADLRRKMMLKCFNLFEGGDKDVWCMIKHLGISNMCAWETWQASDDDAELLELAIESNKMFTKYLTRFLGLEITSCASCFSDALKAKDE